MLQNATPSPRNAPKRVMAGAAGASDEWKEF
jgi:hypothetical protein